MPETHTQIIQDPRGQFCRIAVNFALLGHPSRDDVDGHLASEDSRRRSDPSPADDSERPTVDRERGLESRDLATVAAAMNAVKSDKHSDLLRHAADREIAGDVDGS